VDHRCRSYPSHNENTMVWRLAISLHSQDDDRTLWMREILCAFHVLDADWQHYSSPSMLVLRKRGDSVGGGWRSRACRWR